MTPRILVVIITADTVLPQCLDAIIGQTYENYSWMIHGQRPTFHHEIPAVRTYLNCAANREAARKIALSSDADYFLFLDSDIVIPEGAIEAFVTQAKVGKEIIGGWYAIKNDRTRYVAGRYVADLVFHHFSEPQPSLVRTDLVGLGCAFISRKALADTCFEHGCDKYLQLTSKQKVLQGECGAFSNLADKRGYGLYMDGDVICQHLNR
jgi:glycosyltransferase involved in cell wall biosynthesis